MVELQESNSSIELAGVKFTPSENRIFLLKVRGFGNSDIASALHISDPTVHSHLDHISFKVACEFPDSNVRQTMTRMAIKAVIRGLVTYEDVPSAPRFTVKEMEIAPLIFRGFTGIEMAKLLVLSIKTVETHLSHIDRKLGLGKGENRSGYLGRVGRLTYASLGQLRDGYRRINQ